MADYGCRCTNNCTSSSILASNVISHKSVADITNNVVKNHLGRLFIALWCRLNKLSSVAAKVKIIVAVLELLFINLPWRYVAAYASDHFGI